MTGLKNTPQKQEQSGHWWAFGLARWQKGVPATPHHHHLGLQMAPTLLGQGPADCGRHLARDDTEKAAFGVKSSK